jgi:orsellinic acid C2-O-methyltransferase
MTSQQSPTPPSALPPPLVLYQLGIGHYISRALYLAAKLSIADLLKDGPRPAGELAAATHTHAPSLTRVLRLLASVGVFTEQEDGNFALTPLGEYLRTGVPGSMRASVMLFTGVRIQDSWKELEYCVQTGEPAFRRTSPGADAFSQIEQDPEQAALFDEAMAAFTAQTAIAVAAAYDFSPFRTVMDVGGGNGALLIGILQANPALRGIVFDRPRAIDGARKKIAAAELASRCDAVGGDFFTAVPNGADAYLLKHVIHDWDDAKAVTILRNCHRAMGPHGRLLIVEGVYPPRIDQTLDSRGAAANDVNMLVCTGGRQRSEAEFRSLYDAAGYRLTRIIPTMARVSVIEGDRT